MPVLLMLRSILFAFVLVPSAWAKPPEGSHPVVVAGPLLGQSLEIRNMDESSLCNTGGNWQWIWGNPAIRKADILCLLNGLELAGWDREQNLVKNKPKIEVRPKGGYEHNGLEAIASFFGAPLLDGVSHLGPRLRAKGYVDEESFVGHAYDWRLGVHDWEVTSFPVLRQLVEKATNSTGAPAVLTGLSMAGPYLHSFLTWTRKQDPRWAARHIHAFVPVAAPFNGAVMALSAVVSSVLQTWSTEGECPRCDPPKLQPAMPDHGNLIEELKDWLKGEAMKVADEVFKKIIWNWPSIYWMSTGLDYSTNPPTDPLVITMVNGEVPPMCSMDKPSATKCGSTQTREGWRFDDPKYLSPTQCAECYKMNTLGSCAKGYDEAFNGWVQQLCCKKHQCNAKSYHASELPTLLREIGREDSASMMSYALSVGTTTDPGVPVHCVFSHNVQTFSRLSFATNEDLDKAMVTLDDGDQTVDANSAEVCTRWHSTVKVYRVPGVKHTGALDVEQVLDIIEAVATNDEQVWRGWREPALSDVKVTSNASLAKEEDLLISRKPPMNIFV